MMWAMGIEKDGAQSCDFHITLEKVHAVLSLWSKSPVPIVFLIQPCPCTQCTQIGKGGDR